jgi:hypothetical protein
LRFSLGIVTFTPADEPGKIAGSRSFRLPFSTARLL